MRPALHRCSPDSAPGRVYYTTRKRNQQATVNQHLKVPRKRRRERRVASEHADLDVAIKGGLGEIGGRDERGAVVGDDRLRVEDRTRRVVRHRPGVVKDVGPPLARPFVVPEARCEAGYEVLGWRGLVRLPMDVEHQDDAQPGDGVHAVGEGLEGARVRRSRRRC